MVAIQHFVSELRRRNVLRVAAAYAVVAWVLIQIASILVPTFDVPTWTMRAISVLLFAGFPMALVLAWVFEITPEGVRTDDGSPRVRVRARRKFDVAIVVLAVAAVGYFLWTVDWKRLQLGKSQAPGASSERSIAVLPFTMLGAPSSEQYFGDGLADTLTQALSQVNGLKVIASSSSGQIPSRSKDPRAVGSDLGVASLLEGSVQRSGDTLRVVASVVSTHDGSQVWSKSFDRPMGDLFALQDEIAHAVVDALQVQGTTTGVAPGNASTSNLSAYDAYLLGRERMKLRTDSAMLEAEQYFRQAIARDPNYVLAYASLATVIELTGPINPNKPGQRDDEALGYAQRALALDPKSGEAHASLGELQMDMGKVEDAEASYKRAIELNPNYAQAYVWYSLLLQGLGRSEEAYRLQLKAIELDPLSSLVASNLALTEADRNEIKQAITRLDAVIARDPQFAGAHRAKAMVYRRTLGEMDQALFEYQRALAIEPDGHRTMPQAVETYLDLDLPDLAEATVSRLKALGRYTLSISPVLAASRQDFQKMRDYSLQRLEHSPDDIMALAFTAWDDLAHGRGQAALARYRTAVPWAFADKMPSAEELGGRAGADIGYVYLQMGDKERARKYFALAIEASHLPIRIGPDSCFAEFAARAALGEREQALNAFEHAIAIDCITYWYLLRSDQLTPQIAPLRHEPRFQALLKRIEDRIAIQRARVLAAAQAQKPG